MRDGYLIGCPIGTVLSLTRDHDTLQVIKPGIGVMSTLDARKTRQSMINNGRDLVLKNTEAGIDVVLTPHDPGVLTDAKTQYPTVERDLTDASDGWKALVVLRNYRNDDAGQDRFKKEVEVFGLFGGDGLR